MRGFWCLCFFFQAEDGIRDAQESRGLGDVYKRQTVNLSTLPSGSRSWNPRPFRAGRMSTKRDRAGEDPSSVVLGDQPRCGGQLLLLHPRADVVAVEHRRATRPGQRFQRLLRPHVRDRIRPDLVGRARAELQVAGAVGEDGLWVGGQAGRHPASIGAAGWVVRGPYDGRTRSRAAQYVAVSADDTTSRDTDTDTDTDTVPGIPVSSTTMPIPPVEQPVRSTGDDTLELPVVPAEPPVVPAEPPVVPAEPPVVPAEPPPPRPAGQPVGARQRRTGRPSRAGSRPPAWALALATATIVVAGVVGGTWAASRGPSSTSTKATGRVLSLTSVQSFCTLVSDRTRPVALVEVELGPRDAAQVPPTTPATTMVAVARASAHAGGRDPARLGRPVRRWRAPTGWPAGRGGGVTKPCLLYT